MDNVIVSTLYNRPGFTRQLLEALSRCDGVGEYTYWAFVEPGPPEVIEHLEWARDAGFFRAHHWFFNEQRMGIRLNMQQALTKVFAQRDRVIVLEDDCIPGPDSLRYFEWALDEYERDATVFSVTAYHRPGTKPMTPDQLAAHSERHWADARRRCFFHPWGWATWKDRWQKVGWALPGVSWDKHILRHVQDNGLYEIYPAVPRVKNVGRQKHRNGWAWAGNWELPEIRQWHE